MQRLSAPERTREELRALMNGDLGTAAGRGDLVRLALRFGACIAHLRLPVPHRRFARTTNLLERLFVEERRRLKIIPNGFGEKPVLKVMFGALIRAAERWRGLRFTEFELRQIAAVRKELDQEYEDFDHAAGKVIPAPRFQQIRALTLSLHLHAEGVPIIFLQKIRNLPAEDAITFSPAAIASMQI